VATKPAAPRRRRTSAAEESPSTTNEGPASPTTSKTASSDAASRTSYGRFTLVGEADAHPRREFGKSVAIEGDVAGVAAPHFKRDAVECGAAYVFERTGGDWTQTLRLDSPRPDAFGFACRVGVAEGRVIVFSGAVAPSGVDEFRAYVRDAGGKWTLESE